MYVRLSVTVCVCCVCATLGVGRVFSSLIPRLEENDSAWLVVNTVESRPGPGIETRTSLADVDEFTESLLFLFIFWQKRKRAVFFFCFSKNRRDEAEGYRSEVQFENRQRASREDFSEDFFFSFPLLPRFRESTNFAREANPSEWKLEKESFRQRSERTWDDSRSDFRESARISKEGREKFLGPRRKRWI